MTSATERIHERRNSTYPVRNLPSIRPRTARKVRMADRAGIPMLALCIALIALLIIPAAVSADSWVGGLPLTTVKTDTVTGDLWFDASPAPNWGDLVVTKTFTLPAAAVAEPGRIKWARLYISAYCGNMQTDYAFTITNSFDGDGVSGYEQAWPETGHEAFNYYSDGGNDNSEFTGHSSGEPYLMINDHENRVTSDYFMWYNVTDLISNQTVFVNVDTTGSYDGRIKVITLVAAYDDPSSATQTTYWVNEGHDVCSYYTEDNNGEAAVGTTTFGTTGLSGITSATLTADYMASNNGYYGFPTSANTFTYTGGTPPVEGVFTNLELDRDPDEQGSYSGLDSWDVTSSVTGSGDTTFAYSRYFAGTGTSAFFKIPLAFLVVKSPAPAVAPVAGFAADVVSGTAPLTVTFTDQSTNTPTSWAWDFGDGNTSTEQNPVHDYVYAGYFTVTLTATNAGGSDDETKTDYITVTGAPQINLTFTGANGAATVNTVPATAIFAREPNTVQVKTVKNIGTETATNITVALYASDVSSTNPVNTTVIASLAAGSTAATQTIIDPTIRDLEGASVIYTAVIDPDNLIAETDETDNTRTSLAKIVKYNGYKGKGVYWDGGSNITTKIIFDLYGDVLYSTQPSSTYKSVGWTSRTETWTAADLPVPAGATVEKVYLYVSYNWDTTTSGVPDITTTFNGNTIALGTPYTDKSNFGTYAEYKYGLYPAIDVTSIFNNGGDNVLSMTPNSGNSNALYPSTLVVVYSDTSATRKQIFINEECDELGASLSSYGTTVEEATAYAEFSGMTIDTGSVQGAILHSFAGSAGTDEGNLLFNGQIVATNAWQGGSSTASAQSFDVKNYLTAENNVAGIQGTSSGGMDTLQQILVIEYTTTVIAPDAAFSGTPTSGTVPLTVTFTDLSTNTPTSWSWDFGDGDTINATEQNPVHTYAAAGNYTVTLTATNSAGSDSETITDYITVSSTGIIALPGQTNPPTDPDSDGLYEDLNGNGRMDYNDVYLYYTNMDWIAENEPLAAFDFNGNGRIDYNDVYLLYVEMV